MSGRSENPLTAEPTPLKKLSIRLGNAVTAAPPMINAIPIPVLPWMILSNPINATTSPTNKPTLLLNSAFKSQYMPMVRASASKPLVGSVAKAVPASTVKTSKRGIIRIG